MNRRPRIGITAGDPAGIGPEIAAKAAEDEGVRAICEPILYGPVTSREVAAFERGRVTAAAGRAAYDAIVRAVEDARAGRIDAIATAPINKEAFALAGLPWPGHTDLLAHLTGARRVAMMFYAEALRVVLATVHVPLREVSDVLTQARIDFPTRRDRRSRRRLPPRPRRRSAASESSAHSWISAAFTRQTAGFRATATKNPGRRLEP